MALERAQGCMIRRFGVRLLVLFAVLGTAGCD